MAVQPAIKIKYAPVRTYANFQEQYIGSQTSIHQRGWWPQVPAINGDVYKSCILGGRLFIVGGFTVVDGVARNGFAAIDIEPTLNADTVSPLFNFTWGGADPFPFSVETDGTYIYVGGGFDSVDGVTTINGLSINGLVRFDYNGNLDTTWNPSPNADPSIELIVHNHTNRTIYVAGSQLTAINGTTRNFCAEIPTYGAGGTPTAWNPNPDDIVKAIAPQEDLSLVYVGGDFANIGGSARARLARTNASGTSDSWNPAPDSRVLAIVPDGTNAYVGGNFAHIGVTSVVRNGAAYIDNAGEALVWDPNCDSAVYGIIRYQNMVFLGGDFANCNGSARAGLALVHDVTVWNGSSNDVDDWNPGATGGQVSGILLQDRTIYAFGEFTGGYASLAYLQSVPFPIFTDANTYYVAKTGSDAAAGTSAAPFLTIAKGLSVMDDTFKYVVVKDSGTYSERLSKAYTQTNALPGGLFAADGKAPVITLTRGATAGTYGARVSGRTKFSTSSTTTFCYVSKAGSDATGSRGNISKPFASIAAAITAASSNDTIHILDSSTYYADINIGVKNLTIEAADGEVPTLVNQGGATHIDATGATLNLYGINIADSIKTSGQTILLKKNVNCYDCTFAFNHVAIVVSSATAAGVTLILQNCMFFGQTASSFESNYKNVVLTVDNCYFDGGAKNTSQSGGSGTAIPSAAILYNSLGTGGALTWSITNSTFSDIQGMAGVMFGAGAGGTATGALTVQSCVFQNLLANATRLTMGVTFQVNGNADISYTVDNCYFYRLTGAAVWILATNIGSGTGIIKNSVAFQCCSNWPDAVLVEQGPTWAQIFTGKTFRASFLVGSQSVLTFAGVDYPGSVNQGNIQNCASLWSGRGGFKMFISATTGTATLKDCVNIGGTESGFILRIPGTKSATVTGLSSVLGVGNGFGAGGIYGLGTGVTTLTNSVISGGITGANIGAAVFADDPQFASTSTDSPNVGLLADSPCIDNGVAGVNVGLNRALVSITASAGLFFVDGFTIQGAINFDDGVSITRGIYNPVIVSYCTFDGLGIQGVGLTSRSSVLNCYFQVNGIGVNASDGLDTMARNVGFECSSAFLYLAGPAATIQNNTSYGAQYGQFDFATAIATTLKNNVYAGSGTLDYSGAGTQVDSVVGTISDDATVTGSRQDPLFRDTGTPDLRIQTVETGYPFDSPAKGLADDGGDAGAYGYFYAPVVLTWTTVDFGTNAGAVNNTAYRNPDRVERKESPLKLSEGDTFGGITYSFAAVYKLDYFFHWDGTNPMPTAQVSDLKLIYNTGLGECQISFDNGTTYTGFRVLRSVPFQYTEIQGLGYTRDDVPTPVSTIAFRESS